MNVEQAIEILWDYHNQSDNLQPADLIFVLGSNDLRVAAHAAELYHSGLAGLLLFSGGFGRFTGAWQTSEAEQLAAQAMRCGVPEENILLETKATNTGENVTFSRTLLEERGLAAGIKRVIAVQKPYMLRRTRATLEVQWPQVQLQVSSMPMKFADYISADLPRELVINAIVGDFQRLIDYAPLGFSSPQTLAGEHEVAFETLVRAGFDSQLLPNGTRFEI